MIDSLAILVSTILCVFVVYRAIRLDEESPWYQGPPDAESAPERTKAGWTPPWSARAEEPLGPRR